MRLTGLRRSFAAGVLAIAAFNTLAALSLPRPEMKPGLARVLVWLALLCAHAAAYWFGDRLRDRLGGAGYIALQAAIVFAIGMSGALFPVGAGLYIGLTVYAVIAAGSRGSTVAITFGAIALFALNAIMTSSVYRGATVGLLLAIAGVIAHAIAALVSRDADAGVPAADAPAMPAAAPAAPAVPPTLPGRDFGLTARELEVLAALSSGARNTEIATRLGISERTVKAHLASVYTKLGVESRTAALAVANSHHLIRTS